MFESLDLKDLPRASCGVLRESTSSRPKIWMVKEGGKRAVVKDFSVLGFFARNGMGRFLVWREGKAYRRLKGLPGIPRLYRTLGGRALVFEYVPGVSADRLERDSGLPPPFFEALEQVVAQVHRRGLAHCDLKRAGNILLGEDGRPYLVDWGAAISRTEFPVFPLRLIYERFVLDDCNAVTKLKLRHAPEQVSSRDRARLEYRSRGERTMRSIRNRLRRLGQRIA